jgi:cation:H+ antiporter
VLDTVVLIASLVVLGVSGDQFVIGIGRMAGATGLRPSVVGALVGGLGASLPELVVAAISCARGAPQLAAGSLVGSIVVNVCLGLGVAGLISPIRVDSRTLRREVPITVACVLAFAGLLAGGISRDEGMVVAVALPAVVLMLVRGASLGSESEEIAVEVGDFFESGGRWRPTREGSRVLIGLAAMVLGAELLVRSASAIADRLGMGLGLAGLTIVAIGTSAPVIVIAIQAARRGDHDLVVGNVVGSNLFIALGGAVVLAFVRPTGAAPLGAAPVVVMAAVCVASWAFMARGKTLARWEAAVLVLAFILSLPLVAR